MSPDGATQATTDSSSQRTSSYRAAAASGSVWAVLQLALSKGSAAISTLAFAYLLDPEAVGVAASGLSIVSLLLIFPPPVISDVLVRFGNDLSHWIGAGRKLARMVAMVSFVLIVGAAAAIALTTDRQTLALIVGLLAVRALFESLSYPPLSRLRVGLRFRQIAGIDALVSSTVMVAGIVYAWFTRRPEAVVFGFVAGAIVRWIAFALAAGPRDDAPQPKGSFTVLFADFRHACLGHYTYAIYLVIDRLVLTWLCSDHVVGIYYFAFTLSTQINAALGLALAVVVQPILGHLRDEPVRQLRAFRTVTAALAALAIPAMIAQAALTRLFFAIALPQSYAESAPILEILSIAMCFSCCMGPCLAMLTAQSRFHAYLMMQVGQLALLGSLVTAGALLGGEANAGIYTAVGVLIQFAIFGPFALWLAGQRADLPPAERLQPATALGIFLRPFIISVVAFAPAAYLASADLGLAMTLRALAASGATLASGAIYLLLLRIFAPGTWHDLHTEGMALIGRIRRRGTTTANPGPNSQA